jgi:diguanylate cyclase (GGDEF)-like protein
MPGSDLPDDPPAPRARDRASASDRLAADADQQAARGDRDARRRDAAATDRDDAPGAAGPAVALARSQETASRDEAARLGDVRALARDHATDASDRDAEQREALLGDGAVPDPTVVAMREAAATLRAAAASDRARAAADRARAADDRAAAGVEHARAADDRAMAATDRAMAAADRLRAGADRARAAEDRRAAGLDLQLAHVDDLTGVYARGFGLLRLQDEVDRAHRSDRPFVLAFVDIDGLKQINDRQGHAAGDAILHAVGAELLGQLRSYDPIVRVGGDEFLCAFSDTGLAAAATRLERIEAALAAHRIGASISVGLAELAPGESLEELSARSDARLYAVKQARAADAGPPPPPA